MIAERDCTAGDCRDKAAGLTHGRMTRTIVPPSFGPLGLRVALGVLFLAHAYAKAFVFTFAGSAAFFEAHGLPGWTVAPVVAAETLGGLALVAGFRARLAALGLVPVMLGVLHVHAPNGWVFNAPGGGWEFGAFLLVALLVQALVGPGAYAVDDALRARSRAASGSGTMGVDAQENTQPM
jgi:putative oxidoreductase